MRIAIISDIHSNLQALKAAFSRIDAEGIKEVYCLGDIVGYGGNPNECVASVRERCSYVVLGNHDLAAIDTTQAEYFTAPGRTAAIWTNGTLATEHRDFLANLPMKCVEDSCTLVHASPDSPGGWQYVLSLQIARRQFDHFTTDLCLIGHTHVPAVCGEDLKTFVFKRGMRFIVNVGSVGQPRDGNPQLSFGILDTEAWTYENIRADYDIEGAAAAILKAGLPPVLAARLSQGL
ncbi:MAG: metallophosphoesterase family protein [Bacteroidota bacterium]